MLQQFDTDSASVLSLQTSWLLSVHVRVSFVYCEILFYFFNMLKNLLLQVF